MNSIDDLFGIFGGTRGPRRSDARTVDLSYLRPWIKPYDGGKRIQFGDHAYLGVDPREGDYVILTNPKTNKTTRYRITEWKRFMDPSDQFIASAAFDPR